MYKETKKKDLIKKKKRDEYILSLIIALVFTICFILNELKYIDNKLDVFNLIMFSLIIFTLAFLGFGCIFKIIIEYYI